MSETLPAAKPSKAKTPSITAATEVMALTPGKHRITLRACNRPGTHVMGIMVPSVHLCLPKPTSPKPRVSFEGLVPGAGVWLDRPGDSILIEVHGDEPSPLLLTTYSPASYPDSGLSIAVQSETLPKAAAPVKRERKMTIVAHFARRGDVQGAAGDWIGSLEDKRTLEGFGVKAMPAGSGPDLEYCAVEMDGTVTPWTAMGRYCGTRGRKKPLAGFAVRPKGDAAARIEVAYQAAFASGDTSPVVRDGAVCRSERAADPVVALRLTLVERPFS